MPGLIIAAASSNSGKTFVTLGLLRALRNRGVRVAAAKVGPDYIDPAFQHVASGSACVNLDPWAMSADQLTVLAADIEARSDLVICEGVMGVFDGAQDGTGSTADLAALLGWPVVLVVDVKGMSATAAAVTQGLMRYRNDVPMAGVILNRVGSSRHGQMIVNALTSDVAVFGEVPRRFDLTLPERHLGLVQAGEHPDLECFMNEAADLVGDAVDLEALKSVARKSAAAKGPTRELVPPLGQRIAVARDQAFAFSYDLVLAQWRAAGAEIRLFSPLADETPWAEADAVYLPGGYPELHCGVLASNALFRNEMTRLAGENVPIYGECGGYMVLGEAIIDSNGQSHEMLGLLSVLTSFQRRKLTLGYRRAENLVELPGLPKGDKVRGHEFHYATIVDPGSDTALWQMEDAVGRNLGPAGSVRKNVYGGFLHLIAQEG